MPHVTAESPPGGGVAGWARRWWRALLGELVATALLVGLGVASMFPEEQADLTHPALAFGCLVTALVATFGAVSGAHMNPAVTLAALLHRQLPPAAAAGYVLAQIAGAFVGFGALFGVVSPSGCAGVPAPGPGVSAAGAALMEALLVAVLSAVCGALWAAHDPAAPDRAAPATLGLTVAGLVYAGGKLTGASLNPARALAPAVVMGCWGAHWAYWAGPLAGATAAALAQRFVLAPPRARTPPARPEDLPLHDKHDR